ncbi:MAG: hypothetical protein AB7S93_25600 [Xanthobacteraceae bacterium]
MAWSESMHRQMNTGGRIAFGILIFAALAAAILARPEKWLTDFDQAFYLSIAYDLNHHGVFSNGVFDDVDSTQERPPPGLFFAPLYPALIVAVTRLDPRFRRAVDCVIELGHNAQDRSECEVYARPMLLIHALLLALGVLAIARAAETIFENRALFWFTGVLATIALIPDADLFAFVMTESLTFCLYGMASLAMVLALKRPGISNTVTTGVLFGLLCLTRASFMVLAPVLVMLFAINGRWIAKTGLRATATQCLLFAVAFAAVLGPWIVRNGVSAGKWAMSEEYGSAAIIERFAYDDMTWREFLLAFPYCLPEIGEPIVDRTFGPRAMERFVYYSPQSFFHVGRAHRDQLNAANGRLDPLIGDIVRDEMRERGWWYFAVAIPLGWCGMWIGGYLGLLLVPTFVWAAVAALRRDRPLFLLYAAPPFVMLGLHALLANHYTRYNLILIGPFCASAAWIMTSVAARARSRWRARARE